MNGQNLFFIYPTVGGGAKIYIFDFLMLIQGKGDIKGEKKEIFLTSNEQKEEGGSLPILRWKEFPGGQEELGV